MTKAKILIISVIILAVINVTTLGFMFMHKPHHKRCQATCQQKQICNNTPNGNKECKSNQCDKGGKVCDSSKNKKGNHKGHNKGSHQKFSSMISEKLGFNEEQNAKFEEITKAHFTEIKAQHEEKKELKKRLFGLLKDDSFDNQKKEAIVTENLALEKKILNTKIAHFQSLKAICKPDQVNGLIEIIERMESKKEKKTSHKK